MNSINKITRKIWSNSRMDLDFFMHLPNGMLNGKGKSNLLINVNPVLYIRYKPPKNIAEEYDYAKASYKITPKNLFHVISFFNDIMKWFYDDKFNDLFLLNDDNHLIFNADYKRLSKTTHKGDYDQSVMQAIPTIVHIGDKEYEGIHLYVNKSNYCISLTFQEIGILFGILKDFSFTNEITMSLLCMNYIIENHAYDNNITKENQKTPFD